LAILELDPWRVKIPLGRKILEVSTIAEPNPLRERLTPKSEEGMI
jgi:hypothetical protein